MAVGFFSSQASYSQRAPDPNVVTVVLSPIDRNGDLVTTLTKDDVRVFDEGSSQTISSFERLNEQPISVALLVDTSVSQGRLAEPATFTARSFVENLMRSGIDQMAIVGFTGKTIVEQELTSDKSNVLLAID